MRLSVSQLTEVAALLWEGSYLAKKGNTQALVETAPVGERTEGGG
jgi:hypothetical protein